MNKPEPKDDPKTAEHPKPTRPDGADDPATVGAVPDDKAPLSAKEPGKYDVEWVKRFVADPKDAKAREQAAATLRRCGPLAVDGVVYQYDQKTGSPVRSDAKRDDQAIEDDDAKPKARRPLHGNRAQSGE